MVRTGRSFIDFIGINSSTAVVVQWAGDEFLLCLPGVSALETAQALTSLLHHHVPSLLIGGRQVTFSGGIAMVQEP